MDLFGQTEPRSAANYITCRRLRAGRTSVCGSDRARSAREAGAILIASAVLIRWHAELQDLDSQILDALEYAVKRSLVGKSAPQHRFALADGNVQLGENGLYGGAGFTSKHDDVSLRDLIGRCHFR